jgi:hypothetical protein
MLSPATTNQLPIAFPQKHSLHKAAEMKRLSQTPSHHSRTPWLPPSRHGSLTYCRIRFVPKAKLNSVHHHVFTRYVRWNAAAPSVSNHTTSIPLTTTFADSTSCYSISAWYY